MGGGEYIGLLFAGGIHYRKDVLFFFNCYVLTPSVCKVGDP